LLTGNSPLFRGKSNSPLEEPRCDSRSPQQTTLSRSSSFPDPDFLFRPQTACRSQEGPAVQIPFPPAKSLLRTRFLMGMGFRNAVFRSYGARSPLPGRALRLRSDRAVAVAGKWRISAQLDRKLRPLRVGVVADPISETIGRVTVQEGDGLDGASEAMLRLGAMSATARARALRRWRPSLAASCPTSGRRSR
jgi:hypothetical protein